MKFELHDTGGLSFSGYADDFVIINSNQYKDNLVITNNTITPFLGDSLANINYTDILAYYANDKPDIVLFGLTNPIKKYPNNTLIKDLQKNGIGLELMSIQATCRTFNFLIGEHRNIVCFILFNH